MSAPGSNRLVQTTPAVNTFFNGTPLSDFEAFSTVDMTLEVTKSTDGSVMTCASANNCLVRYSWDYTPIISYVVPQIIFPGMIPTVIINTKNAPNYKHADQLAMQIRVDGTSFNYTNGYNDDLADPDFTINNNYNARISGKVETTERNATT